MTIKYLKFFFGLIFFVFIFLVLFSERETTQKNFKNYNITFNKIDGVQIGTDVFISGINVGFVNKITLKKNYPLVSILVDDKIKLPSDSSVAIQTDGLFGAKFLLIEMGGSDDIMSENSFFSFYEDSILVEDLLKRIIEMGELKKNEI